METAKLRKFAQFARRNLIEQVGAKLKLVLAEESPARRESPSAIKKLEEAIAEQGKEQVVERVAYIWFNRLVALRFMDVNRYNRIGVVSPAEGQFQPEILADAKMGHIDEDMVSESTRKKIFALLDGKTPSQDPQGETYRLLVVAACNYWYSAMPFLFERIDDYTELLMPDDLLSGNSILAYTREAMTPDVCEDVEVIGWLYQFYISEKKDEVIGKVVASEDIPAATQLFTPNWIVKYLVQNTLGRQWLAAYPQSALRQQMEYYIEPAEQTPEVQEQLAAEVVKAMLNLRKARESVASLEAATAWREARLLRGQRGGVEQRIGRDLVHRRIHDRRGRAMRQQRVQEPRRAGARDLGIGVQQVVEVLEVGQRDQAQQQARRLDDLHTSLPDRRTEITPRTPSARMAAGSIKHQTSTGWPRAECVSRAAL